MRELMAEPTHIPTFFRSIRKMREAESNPHALGLVRHRDPHLSEANNWLQARSHPPEWSANLRVIGRLNGFLPAIISEFVDLGTVVSLLSVSSSDSS